MLTGRRGRRFAPRATAACRCSRLTVDSRGRDDRLALSSRAARDLQASARRRFARSRRCRAQLSVAHAVDRLRRREADCAGAAAACDNIDVDPGGLAALRPEARAGRADDRRRRRRWRRGGRCRASLGARRSPLEEIRGNIRAAGLEPVERNGRFERTGDVTPMRPVRLGAVDYLNARPLVYGLGARVTASRCASTCRRSARALLHEGAIDLGMIPSIEYLRGAGRTASCPASAIASDGPVASVAMFTHASRCRTIRIDRAGHQLAHVGRAAPRAVRASASASTPSSCRWRPISTAMLARLRRGAAHRRPGAVPRPRRARAREKIDLGRAVDGDDRPAVRLGVLGRPARMR